MTHKCYCGSSWLGGPLSNLVKHPNDGKPARKFVCENGHQAFQRIRLNKQGALCTCGSLTVCVNGFVIHDSACKHNWRTEVALNSPH